MAERKEEKSKEREDTTLLILSKVEAIEEALLGGRYNPEGLIARVQKIEVAHKEYDRANIIPRLHELDKYKESDKKFKWMLAGGTVAVSTFLKTFWAKLLIALGI